MIFKKRQVDHSSSNRNRPQIRIKYVFRRIPNVGHLIYGFEASMESFYLSICDVNKLLSYLFTRLEIFENNLECHASIMGMGTNDECHAWTNCSYCVNR